MYQKRLYNSNYNIIIIIEKYKLNDAPQIIGYNIFYKELKNTISIM